MGLEEPELEALFKEIDYNGDQQITYAEFIKQFSPINTVQITKRVQRIL